MEVDWSLVVILVAINGLVDAAGVSYLAGWWSLRKWKAWLFSKESDPYVERITKQVSQEIDAVRSRTADVEGRIEALGESISADVAATRTSFEGRAEALSKQVSEVEARLGGRLPSDYGAVIDGKLREFEQRLIVREARAEEAMRKDREKMAQVLATSPQVMGSPAGQQLVNRLNLAALPKKWQSRLAIAQAIGLMPAGAPSLGGLGAPTNGGAALAPFAPAKPIAPGGPAIPTQGAWAELHKEDNGAADAPETEG